VAQDLTYFEKLQKYLDLVIMMNKICNKIVAQKAADPLVVSNN